MKVLVVSHDCFSESNANGKTLKALLHAFKPSELAQFYTGTDEPDCTFCGSYYHLTDIQMLKSFIRKVSGVSHYAGINNANNNYPPRSSIKSYWKLIRRFNYNFFIRLTREYLWIISFSWKKEFHSWVQKENPSVILYMVGDSFFQDRLVLSLSYKYKIPIVLFNVEAYRIIKLEERHFLEKLFYKTGVKFYKRLQANSSAVIFNCNMLKESFEAYYESSCANSVTIYNSSTFDNSNYCPQEGKCNLVYFGNLNVGRVDSLVLLANTLTQINPTLFIDVYGPCPDDDVDKLHSAKGLRYYGMVSQDKLVSVKAKADILIHVESFNPHISGRLKYAFSTKIAQYLCAGRSVFCYLPKNTASSNYLIEEGAALVVTEEEKLSKELDSLIGSPIKRQFYANRAVIVGKKNHDAQINGNRVRELIIQCI